jgi:hypothetical protein
LDGVAASLWVVLVRESKQVTVRENSTFVDFIGGGDHVTITGHVRAGMGHGN